MYQGSSIATTKLLDAIRNPTAVVNCQAIICGQRAQEGGYVEPTGLQIEAE